MSGGFTAEGAAVPLALRGRLRHAARDALEWLLLPAVSAVMPWRWSFRFYRRVAQSDRLFAAATRSVLAASAARRPPAEPTAWAAAYRLVQLIDRADLWLSRFRSDRWIDRHLDVEGNACQADHPSANLHAAPVWAIRRLCRGSRRASLLSCASTTAPWAFPACVRTRSLRSRGAQDARH
jgi:hypothetical protein